MVLHFEELAGFRLLLPLVQNPLRGLFLVGELDRPIFFRAHKPVFVDNPRSAIVLPLGLCRELGAAILIFRALAGALAFITECLFICLAGFFARGEFRFRSTGVGKRRRPVILLGAAGPCRGPTIVDIAGRPVGARHFRIGLGGAIRLLGQALTVARGRIGPVDEILTLARILVEIPLAQLAHGNLILDSAIFRLAGTRIIPSHGGDLDSPPARCRDKFTLDNLDREIIVQINALRVLPFRAPGCLRICDIVGHTAALTIGQVERLPRLALPGDIIGRLRRTAFRCRHAVLCGRGIPVSALHLRLCACYFVRRHPVRLCLGRHGRVEFAAALLDLRGTYRSPVTLCKFTRQYRIRIRYRVAGYFCIIIFSRHPRARLTNGIGLIGRNLGVNALFLLAACEREAVSGLPCIGYGCVTFRGSGPVDKALLHFWGNLVYLAF